MAWIESNQELGQHPKTKKLARLLSINLPEAVGHLHYLWWWALTYAQDGNLYKFEADDIADAVLWNGDPALLVNSLITAGFLDDIDGELTIHDWCDYAGRLLEQRAAQSEYKERKYALYNDMRLTRSVKARDENVCQYCGKEVIWSDKKSADGGTYDLVDPNGENVVENIVVCCRGCSAKKGGKTVEQAGVTLIYGKYTADLRQKKLQLPYPTVPNLTVPYPTIPNLTEPNSIIPPLPPASGGSGGGNDLSPDVTEKTIETLGVGATTQAKKFEAFWEAYPKKVGRQAALKVWNRIKPNVALFDKIMSSVSMAKTSEQWRREGGRFIPNPTTWLNQGRWDDELPTTGGVDSGQHDINSNAYGRNNGADSADWNSFKPSASRGFKQSDPTSDKNGS